MMNYLDVKNLHDVSVTHYLDALGDIRNDISGAAQTVCNMATAAHHDVTIEAEQLELLADVLTLASDALGGLLFDMNNAHEVEQIRDEG